MLTEDDAFQRIREAFDASLGCDHDMMVVDFCCQWNQRTPCPECALLEQRVRQVLRDMTANT